MGTYRSVNPSLPNGTRLENHGRVYDIDGQEKKRGRRPHSMIVGVEGTRHDAFTQFRDVCWSTNGASGSIISALNVMIIFPLDFHLLEGIDQSSI